ncbi:response regulator [Caulobacter sp. S45]|uniref:response regulator n=1 Tax=Caulobacter sp. S45 TaxID=1641861 RepID=UPI00131B805C|nr:response regulator [Caulobacter sp. S45]
MTNSRVLIVEDDPLIALDVEQSLLAAGFNVCGVAASEAEALALAERFRPELAIVDISLNPGDGRVVAKALCGDFATAVLFATGQCDEVEGMSGTGAVACLPKPYNADLMPAALAAVRRMAQGERTEPLPDYMFALAA